MRVRNGHIFSPSFCLQLLHLWSEQFRECCICTGILLYHCFCPSNNRQNDQIACFLKIPIPVTHFQLPVNNSLGRIVCITQTFVIYDFCMMHFYQVRVRFLCVCVCVCMPWGIMCSICHLKEPYFAPVILNGVPKND